MNKVDIVDWVQAIEKDFTSKTSTTINPQTNKLFQINANSSRLNKEEYHAFHAKFIFCVREIILAKNKEYIFIYLRWYFVVIKLN